MTIKDGDIYRWRYKDEKPEQLGAWGRYHCKSMIAVAENGLLIDTFWNASASNSAWWSHEDAKQQLNLTYLGNFADLEKKPEYHAAYYDDADCVNLNHSNSSRDNFYVRKGAQRSRDKMLATLAEQMDEAERTIRSQQGKLDRLKQTTAEIEGGKPLEEIYL